MSPDICDGLDKPGAPKMIVSHEHKFIFLKTKKTAGTSIELALSELCGPALELSRVPFAWHGDIGFQSDRQIALG